MLAPDTGFGVILLSNNNGGNGHNYTNTHFTPNSTTQITSGVAPFTGDFLPEGNFSFFDNYNADGNWFIQVCETSGDGDIGDVLDWSIAFAPINDEIEDAIPLTVGSSFQSIFATATNVGATNSTQVAEPTICGLGSSSTVNSDLWYTVIVPASGNVNIETYSNPGSFLAETVMAVYTSDLNLIGCDANGGSGLFSKVQLTGQTPGAFLYVRVWEHLGDTSPGTFNISAYADPPANDNFLDAQFLTVGLNFNTNAEIGTNAYATSNGSNPMNCSLDTLSNVADGDIWYTVTVPYNGILNIETQATDVIGISDTVMAVYSADQTNTTTTTITQIDCDDDAGFSNFSLINLTGQTPGDLLYIRVWEYGNNDFGTFKISTYTDAPVNDDPAGAIEITVGPEYDSNVVTFDYNGSLTTASEITDATIANPNCGTYQGSDIWFKTVIPSSGTTITIEPNTIGINGGVQVYEGTIGALTLGSTCINFNTGGFTSSYNSTPGETVYLRFWGSNNTNTFNYGLTVFSPSSFTNVPDDNFETYLETHNTSRTLVTIGDTTSMGNGVMDDYVPTAKINTVTNLDVNNQGIVDITGLEGFSALIEFQCDDNELTALNVSANTALTLLNCRNNNLDNLNVNQNNSLQIFSCDGNNLSSLDLSSNTNLNIFSCNGNNIINLDLNPKTTISKLNCGNNALVSLSFGNSSNILLLIIDGNPNLTCVALDDVSNADDWNNNINTPSAIFQIDTQTSFNGTGTCPTVNDLPLGATTLSVGGNFEQFAIVDSNANTTASELTITTILATTCSFYNGADLWYAIEIPEDGCYYRNK